MTAPGWLSAVLAAVMVAIAGYCAIRPVVARRWKRYTEHDVDLAHVLMGVAMAAMLELRLTEPWDSAWAVVFAGAAAWFGGRAALARWRGRRGTAGRAERGGRNARSLTGHHLTHLLSCGGMAFMLLAATAPRTARVMSMASAPATGRPVAGASAAAVVLPVLALGLVLATAGSVVLATDRLAVAAVRPARQLPSSGQDGANALPLLCPRLAGSCQIAMGIAMIYMLVQLL